MTARTFEPDPADYSDRIWPPADTVARLRPHFERLGITRLARQTGLDRLGIPCFAAIRPNARTLATNQGKGIDDDAAMASAVMEAAEYALAEAPSATTRYASLASLRREGTAFLAPDARLPHGVAWPEHDELPWLEGMDYFTGRALLVPLDSVAIAPASKIAPPLSRSTNGLASGNVAAEAGFHALCELIERDAMTLWAFRAPAFRAQAALTSAAFADPVVDGLAARIADCGLALKLFDLTTDIGVPVIMALIEEPGAHMHFDLASGMGCHPVAVRAAIRAITEAAQTRISNLAGARDDFDPAEYRQRLLPELSALGQIVPGERTPPDGARLGTRLVELHEFVAAALRRRGIDEVAMTSLGGAEFGIAVVKAIAPALEDMPGNPHWRPGPRAASAMTRLW